MGSVDKVGMGEFDREIADMCTVGWAGFVDMGFGMNSVDMD
jgi:hypothetical protein